SRRVPRPAACSMVALLSVVFLYHRNYDTVILALPLVYCTGSARVRSGLPRLVFALSATAVLLVLELNIGLMVALRKASSGCGLPGRVVQAVVLPYATGLVVGAMIGISVASRRIIPRQDREGPGEAAPGPASP